MKTNFKAKQLFLSLLIPLVKGLIIIKKIIGFTLSLLGRPLRFIARTLFYYPIVKLYGFYILSAKKWRELNNYYNSRWQVLQKFLSISFLITLTLILGTKSLAAKLSNEDFNNRMAKTPAAGLITNDFESGAGAEELIVETNNLNCDLTPPKYVSPQTVLRPQTQINTNVKSNNNNEISCLTPNNEALINSANGQIDLGTANSSADQDVRRETTIYTVKKGETIAAIASSFGVSVNTILWANNLTAKSTIGTGQKLKIPPLSGVLHKVAKGETLGSIAKKYNINATTIAEANSLNNSVVHVGEELMIPGGKKIVVATPVVSSAKPAKSAYSPNGGGKAATPSNSKFQWPTVGYTITQYFSWRHTGVDIANKIGTSIYAAESGTVEKAGWNSGGYGNMILLNNGNGIKTRYGHASQLFVQPGDEVERGQVIAAMGSTGHSTGPHLHFEVILNGHVVNPLNYIR